MIDPPQLSRGFADMGTVVGVGTALWLLGAGALLLVQLLGGPPVDVGFATCLAGALLGGVGFGVFSWQRAAARRGSRTAQQGLDRM